MPPDADTPKKSAKCSGCGETVPDGCNECAMCAVNVCNQTAVRGPLMSTLRQPGPPFKKADTMITCVVSVPEKKVEYLKLLIDNYATAPTLPPELVELLLNFKQQLPS